MEIVILPAKYKNIGEMFNSPEFTAFKEKCLKDYQTYMNQRYADLIKKNMNLPSCKVTFKKVDMNDFFNNIPIGGNIVGLQGEHEINYYSPINTIKRFCIITELTKDTCLN